jgi:hypothetical protein
MTEKPNDGRFPKRTKAARDRVYGESSPSYGRKGFARVGRSFVKKQQYVPNGLARTFCRHFLGLVYSPFLR